MNIPLALRLIACGLPVPKPAPQKAVVWNDNGTCFDPDVRILFTVVTADDGPRLLPDTGDPLLIGFVLAECRKRWPYIGTWYAPSHPGWMAGLGGRRWHAETELEALTAAWEAALKAAE